MMLRVFLVASLLAVALAVVDDAQLKEVHMVADHYGCCSMEDRREIQYLWETIWSSSFTHRKIAIARAIFDESVHHLAALLCFSQSRHNPLGHNPVIRTPSFFTGVGRNPLRHKLPFKTEPPPPLATIRVSGRLKLQFILYRPTNFIV